MTEEKFNEAVVPLDNGRAAYAILGRGDEFLNIYRNAWPDCKFTLRGDSLVIAGENCSGAAAAINELLTLVKRDGATLARSDVNYAVSLAKAGKAAALSEMSGDVLLTAASGQPIRPRTLGQQRYLKLIRRHEVTLATGPAGSGKTFLAVAMAVFYLRAHEVKRLVLTRPAVEAGERLGFLPGDFADKVDPYLRPLYDALGEIMGDATRQKLMAKGTIEIAPLAFMRGRTLNDAFVILDEGQNTTGSQMKMFLTRLGHGSKMVVTGDLSQADLPRGVVSGLREAVEILRGVEGIAVAELKASDIVRHEVVGRILAAYEKKDFSSSECGVRSAELNKKN